jgi:transposase
MAGKSPVVATPEQRAALEAKACGPDRAEADRARAVLLTLRGWTSARIAEAFGVREDTVRFWRGQFLSGGVEGLETWPLPGPAPLKTQAALRVAEPLLSTPVTNRVNWTLARLADAIAAQQGVTISKSQLSKALRKKGAFATAYPATP